MEEKSLDDYSVEELTDMALNDPDKFESLTEPNKRVSYEVDREELERTVDTNDYNIIEDEDEDEEMDYTDSDSDEYYEDEDESGEEDSEDSEEVEEVESEDSEEEDSEEDIISEYLDLDILKNKKVKIKWNGTEMDLDADKLIDEAQKGVDYSIKKAKLKEASDFYEDIKKTGISKEDIESYIKFKNSENPVDAIKDFIASNNIDLDELRDNIYEFDREDVAARKQEFEDYRNNYNPLQDIITNVDDKVNEKFDELAKTIPGFYNFSSRTYNSKNVQLFNTILACTSDGSFDLAKDDINRAYANMTPEERYRFENDDKFFIDTYDSIVKNINEGIPTSTVESEGKPTSKVSIDEDEKKSNASRKSKSTPTKVKKDSKTTNDILREYLELGDSYEDHVAQLRNELKNKR